MLCTSKESLEHVEFKFRIKKYDNLKKKTIFEIFLIFFSQNWSYHNTPDFFKTYHSIMLMVEFLE